MIQVYAGQCIHKIKSHSSLPLSTFYLHVLHLELRQDGVVG